MCSAERTLSKTCRYISDLYSIHTVEKFLFSQVTQTVLFDNICVIVYAAEIVMILSLSGASSATK